MGSPWAFKIDYDKEIANDLREIALYDSDIVKKIAASLSAEEADHKGLFGSAHGLIVCNRSERRPFWQTIFCVTDRQLVLILEAAHCYHDEDHDRLEQSTGLAAEREVVNVGERAIIAKMRAEGAEVKDWMRAANEYRAAAGAKLRAERQEAEGVLKQLCGIPVHTEAMRVKYLKAAKTHLATHRRNQKKYGGK